MTAIEQHNREIHANAEVWRRKPLLRDIYDGFYARIAAELPPADLGPVVELGSGMGNIKRRIPHCITTDLFSNEWLDRQENAYALSSSDSSVGAFVLFDVFHHLRHPGAVLRELHRTLRPGGRVILFEPDMGLVGRFIYNVFHHEPLEEKQVGDLLNDFERIGNAADPELIPDAVNLAANFTGSMDGGASARCRCPARIKLQHSKPLPPKTENRKETHGPKDASTTSDRAVLAADRK